MVEVDPSEKGDALPAASAENARLNVLFISLN